MSDLLLLAENNRQKISVVNGLISNALAHVHKIQTSGGPEGDPDFEHHKKEIKAALDRARAKLKRLPGKAAEQLKKTIEKIEAAVGSR